MELIDKFEKARVGSRDLDADFYEALGFRVKREFYWKWFSEETRRWCSLCHPTTSIDDAVSKIPPDHLRTVDAAKGGPVEVALFVDGPPFIGVHKQEPMATCLAILLAQGE